MSKSCIVLAVDFSKHSETCVAAAIQMARDLDARVHVIHALHIPVLIVPSYEAVYPESFFEDTRKLSRNQLDAITAQLVEAGIDTRSHLAEGSPANAIAAFASEVDARLIVMGTHGHTGLKHTFLGSVAERTLRLAHCSVLVAKGEGDLHA